MPNSRSNGFIRSGPRAGDPLTLAETDPRADHRPVRAQGSRARRRRDPESLRARRRPRLRLRPRSSMPTVRCSASTRMVHITDYPCFHEQGYYTPGDTGAPVYRTRAGSIGVAICYDRHYPEYMRALALGGADLVVVPQAGAVGEWPDGLVRSGDAGRGVSERLLRGALQPRRCGRLPDVRRRVVRRARRMAASSRGRRRWKIRFSPPTSTSSTTRDSHARQLFLQHRRPELYGDWLNANRLHR